MTWGIEFKSDIFLSKQSYISKDDVEDKIKEISDSISECESKLMMYAIATPKDIVSTEDSENIIYYISNEIRELVEEHEELIINRFKLNQYLEYLNEGGKMIQSE